VDGITIERCHPVGTGELNSLFSSAWKEHQPRDFDPVLRRSLVYFTAHHDGRLIGFVNVAWDGGLHGFIVDTTVHPDFQRRGIGLALLRAARAAAFDAGLEWLHVDYEAELATFYDAAGFRPTAASVWRVRAEATDDEPS
jgi:GNAT superfamily N-acetyltransferase